MKGRKIMDRVLSLQGLVGFSDADSIEPANSGESGVCSLQSSGAGRSSCSISCGKLAEFDW
jgi:hypothetical protein